MDISPPLHRTLRSWALQELTRRILRGELAPGARLIETELAGQMGLSRSPIREALERYALGIVAPDLQKTGGLLETRRIADMADTYYVSMAPHNISSPIGFMAAVHVGAAIPNFLMLEFHAMSVPFWDDLVLGVPNPIIRDGYVAVPDAPGLGIELNEEVARRYAREGAEFF